ncbi:hypothetical protein PRK78_003315 [Emydomyces testavorans]|uniref:Nuclear pore complex protein An-Nup82 n=1 Tax=Emydomyces testavorans TaxID=2070801 RepID=A0AAF0DGK5_9EURO|nr:hypothetical protein PRK78_003315 [Emydomyces testavorans]
MPRVIDYAPAWLSRPSPGATFFSASSTKAVADKDAESFCGPTKVLARRGTEVFAVVDNQIRWTDLALLKDQWQEGVRQKRKGTSYGGDDTGSLSSSSTTLLKNGISDKSASTQGTGDDEASSTDSSLHYKVLTAPVYGQIRQLVPSPNGAFLAILTAHTIHIAVLPDQSHLSDPDSSPLRLRTYQLGPATHVIPESPVVSALWHPLGVYDNYGGCIVTVTADSAVRVWEIDRRDNWSFDRPSLAIDLKKLVDGTSSDEDFAPSGFGHNKGFSADLFDMEAASASFGGHGYGGEDSWAPMTLWIAMRQGDVYALCPLLPSKWRAPSLTIPCLTTSIVHKLAATQENTSDEDDERKVLEQQYEWLQEIDNQEPLPDGPEFSEIRARPARPSTIPRLQGPFQFNIEEEPEDLDITDIFVIVAKSDTDDLLRGEDDADILEENNQGGISGTIVCLLTENGMVHIALEMDGVEGQWLPQRNQSTFSTPMSDASELLLLESLETVKEKYRQANSWPTFTEDALSRYGFFVTTANNVTFISLSSWAQRVEPELQSDDTTGSAFRINIICDGPIAEREQIIQLPVSKPFGSPEHLTNSLVLYDFDLGYMLLTYVPSQVCAVALESAATGDLEEAQDLITFEPSTTIHQPYMPMLQRPPYQVPSVLYSANPLASFINDHVPHGHRHTLKEPIRLSPSTLDTITAAHRILSAYTHTLEKAASDLFRRCERLQGEMRDQLSQLVDIAGRINDVSQGTVRYSQQSNKGGREEALDSRMAAAKSKQKELAMRYNTLRSKLLRGGCRPISDKEKGWIQEVDMLADSIGGVDGDEQAELVQRLKTAKSLAEELVSEAKRLSHSSPSEPSAISAESISSPLKVPHRLQKAKVTDAMNMVEREAAVIDAITSRLERLNTSASEL